MAYGGNPTVKSFKKDMLEVGNQLKYDLETRYLKMADELIENMKASVPIVSGNLKRSLRKKNVTARYSASRRVSVLVFGGGPLTTKKSSSGVSYDYALSVEFGDRDEEARPFFYANARRYRQAGIAGAAETVDQAIKANNELRARRATNENLGGVIRGGRGGATFL